MAIRTIGLVFVVLIVAFSGIVHAMDSGFSNLTTSQKVLEAFKIYKIKDSLTREDLKKICEGLDSLKATDCLILEMVKGLQRNYGVSSIQQLRDKLSNQERIFREVTTSLLAAVGKSDLSVHREIEALARKIASIENSQSFVDDKVIPFVKVEIEKQSSDISEIKAAIRIAGIQYERVFGSLCERLENHENRIAQLESGKLVAPQDSGDAHPVGPPLESVNGTKWEPQAYASTSELCSNPKPGPKNVFFDTNVLTNREWIKHRHIGDIWIDCSGRIVMVLRNSR